MCFQGLLHFSVTFHSAQSRQGRAHIMISSHADINLAPLSSESDASQVWRHLCRVYWTALSVRMTSAQLCLPENGESAAPVRLTERRERKSRRWRRGGTTKMQICVPFRNAFKLGEIEHWMFFAAPSLWIQEYFNNLNKVDQNWKCVQLVLSLILFPAR